MTDFTPDYEMPVDANMDNVYEVTVVATVVGMSGTRDVRVTIGNMEEMGIVTLNRKTPRVGVPVTATLTDPDGSVSGLTWQWSITGAVADGTPNGNIERATSDTYVPKAGDVDGILTATATYDDGHSSEGDDKKTANATAVAVDEDTRNKPPAFEDQDADMDGVQNTAAERKVDENTGALATDDADEDAEENAADNVGSAVTANDPDPNTDPLIYTLSGADAGAFRVRGNGQIEVAAGTELDHETKDTYDGHADGRGLLRGQRHHHGYYHGHRHGRSPGDHEDPRSKRCPRVRFRQDQQNGGGEHGCRRGHRQPGGGKRR